jgi:hypothetical protein
MKRIIATIMVAMLVLGAGSIESKAYDRCGYNGCSAENTSNGTVFCDTHAALYASEKGYKACAASGCWGRATKDSRYCSRHTCSNSKCTSKVVEGTRYCSTHTEKTSTNKSSNKSSGYTTKRSTSSSKSSTNKSSSKKSGSKKSYDPYDVHKYKSAQDFADDKYEEFYDYEDDYEDEDEAYDAAEDYWNDYYD